MTNLEPELDALKENLLEMIDLVSSQLAKCKEATLNGDIDLAKIIVSNDKRVNALELKIDKDCENILALYNPVAIDLRFVLAALKINNDLERIGDNAESIAQLVADIIEKPTQQFVEKYKLVEMYDLAIAMLDDVSEAMENEDTQLAREIFKKDQFLNDNNANSPLVTIELIKDYPEKAREVLALFSTIRKLERIGDLTKNLGEEIVFHIEAKVMKHRKLQKAMKKEKSKNK